jgi:hypothetical protein
MQCDFYGSFTTRLGPHLKISGFLPLAFLKIDPISTHVLLQVSKQHVIQAANNSKLTITKEILSRWLTACDPISRGIYSIPKLVNFLERSKPNVVNRQRVKTAGRMMSGRELSKSHGHLSCK